MPHPEALQCLQEKAKSYHHALVAEFGPEALAAGGNLFLGSRYAETDRINFGLNPGTAGVGDNLPFETDLLVREETPLYKESDLPYWRVTWPPISFRTSRVRTARVGSEPPSLSRTGSSYVPAAAGLGRARHEAHQGPAVTSPGTARTADGNTRTRSRVSGSTPSSPTSSLSYGDLLASMGEIMRWMLPFARRRRTEMLTAGAACPAVLAAS